ncbi:MAG TPA: 5-methyltetrahydropteroyltriglutamate--homocysteine S-methyltransferase, partial [Arthrobacter sp.]|nr:5-methyltetrahydropteroyltriglutamate--homocysteine S-methyltransferase [Arthrobacter sp.]
MTNISADRTTPFPAASILGYPRIGRRRELKKAIEAYWAGTIDAAALDAAAKEIQLGTARRLQDLGLTEDAAVPGTFSYYDQVLDAAAHLGAVPARFGSLLDADGRLGIDGYFTLARGTTAQQPLEMTKWFDTNYHYLVPEIDPETSFALTSTRIVEEFEYALANGVHTRPYLVGPVTFLLLSKASDDAPAGFSPLSRLEDILPVYTALLEKLAAAGASWVQLDEPSLVVDQDVPAGEIQAAVARTYEVLSGAAHRPQLFVSTPYGALDGQLGTLAATGIDALHLDVFKGAVPSAAALAGLGAKTLVAGVVDGHNIWRNDLAASAAKIEELQSAVGRLAVSTSTSTQHVPHDVEEETALSGQLRSWLAFADQKVAEVVTLSGLLTDPATGAP